jgi:hypothetical protein
MFPLKMSFPMLNKPAPSLDGPRPLSAMARFNVMPDDRLPAKTNWPPATARLLKPLIMIAEESDPKAAPLVTTTAPCSIVVGPVKSLVPVSSSVPPPLFVKPAVPCKTEAIVS